MRFGIKSYGARRGRLMSGVLAAAALMTVLHAARGQVLARSDQVVGQVSQAAEQTGPAAQSGQPVAAAHAIQLAQSTRTRKFGARQKNGKSIRQTQQFATPSRLRGVKSWAYQLQGTRVRVVARSPYDLVVVDYSQGGGGARPYTAREVRAMQRKPGGGHRFVLAYISVGEAEDYRFYWRRAWVETLKLAGVGAGAEARGNEQARDNPPPPTRSIRIPRLTAPNWLGRENDAWSGNYAVRYWDPAWQKLIFGTRRSYLERIIAAGFDGIYIDRVDAYYSLVRARPKAEQEMADFIIALARHARTIKPGFIIVPQNAEELLLRRDYLAQIDGIAKEDLFYGGHEEGVANSSPLTRNSLRWLGRARKRKLPVFVIEYLDKPAVIAKAARQIKRRKFIGYFGPRSLDRLANPREWILPQQ